jgi:hypothetical protein
VWRLAVPLARLGAELPGVTVRLEAEVTAEGERYQGWAEVRLVRPLVRLAFLGARTVTPGLPFELVVTAVEQDSGPLARRSLASAQVVLETLLHLRNGSLVLAGVAEKRREPAVAAWKHSSSLAEAVRGVPGVREEQVAGLVLSAAYSDGGRRASARRHLRLVDLPAASTGPRLAVASSTRRPRPGENIVFHVRSSAPVSSISYLVTGRGRVLLSAEVAMAPHTVRTFHIPVTAAMAPAATLVVHCPGSHDALQSIVFPVSGAEVGFNFFFSIYPNFWKYLKQ